MDFIDYYYEYIWIRRESPYHYQLTDDEKREIKRSFHYVYTRIIFYIKSMRNEYRKTKLD